MVGDINYEVLIFKIFSNKKCIFLNAAVMLKFPAIFSRINIKELDLQVLNHSSMFNIGLANVIKYNKT
jgi:hypothetical protein